MVIDTSAIIAILRFEPEATQFIEAIAKSAIRVMSAVSLHEAGLVLAGRQGGAEVWQELDALIARASIEIAAFDATQARLAREAFIRFGKGRHPAALNLGDCAAYALARTRGLPLLFKGTDFTRTDIVAVRHG
jgi:ribonuclease VapC